jgi:DNA repair protein RecO (recombination protein O)
MGRSYKTEAVVLRSIRYSEADRVLHLFSLDRGRVNAIAKGVRKTGSRFGARLEPLTRSALLLHEGRGELHTISGADIISSHEAVRADNYTLAVGLIGAEAVLKLHAEPEPQPRAYQGLCRFLDLLGGPVERAPDATHDGLGLAFQLKLLALAGYLPHLVSCASCGRDEQLVGFSLSAGGGVCAGCLGATAGFAVGERSVAAIEGLLDRPLTSVALEPRAAADALRVVEETYAHHGGFRLRTLHTG